MASSDPFDFFKSSKRSEVSELENELNHNKVERRMEALKKVILSFSFHLGYCHDDYRQRCFRALFPSLEMCRDSKP
jgi:hypothetical protein